MFGVSLGEVLVILVIALILIKPEEIADYIKIYKNFLSKLQDFRNKFNVELKEGLNLKEYTQEINEKIKIIVGEDGKKYESYELPQEETKIFKNSNKNDS